MKIAILGGSFNPPHLGHLLMANQVLEFTDIDEVWLTPCYRHTFDKKLAPVEDRATMTKLLVDSEDTHFGASLGFTRGVKRAEKRGIKPAHAIKFCDEEIKNKLSGDSIDLLNILKKKYLHHFSFIIGSDNLANFKRWGRWEKLITENDFLIFPRPGFSTHLVDYDLDNKKYRFELVKNDLLVITNISSTIVRERIENKLLINHLVPDNLVKYISENKLYIK